MANSLAFGRACQSARTGFLHLFNGQMPAETIPLFENFCFAILLIRQKTVEGVTEGKKLLERLYAFQAPDGFPVYLHDYPCCYNRIQPLRIAPLLKQLLLSFSHVLDDAFRQKTARALEHLIASARRERAFKPFPPLWERRFLALTGESVPSGFCRSSQDWAEELITAHLLGAPVEPFIRLVHPTLKVYSGPSEEEAQEGKAPRPTLLGLWAGESSPPHPLHLELASLDLFTKFEAPWSGAIEGWQIRQKDGYALSFARESLMGKNRLALRLIWKDLHSLCIATGEDHVRIVETQDGLNADFDLPESFEEDSSEIILFCDRANEIDIEGKKATLFSLGDRLTVRSSGLQIHLQFNLEEGTGDFCGHLSLANRPFQAVKGYDAFDWQISLRTIRRQRARMKLRMSFLQPSCPPPCPSHGGRYPQKAPLP
jgi:hypothetical protein